MAAPTVDQHLEMVEKAIQHAKQLVTTKKYSDDRRTVVVAGIVDQMFEHHASVLILIRSQLIGSAFALARSIYEGLYRGMWLNRCATDDQVEGFAKDDKLPLQMRQLAEAIDKTYTAGTFFVDLLDRAWSALCSYTHTGVLQLGRRFTGNVIKPAYNDQEIIEVSTSATTFVLLLVGKFLAVSGYADECMEVEALISTYGAAALRGKRE